MDPHDVLNVPRAGFSADQLRYNYKALARQLHPDKRAPNMAQRQATEMFQVLTEAYRTLCLEVRARDADKTHDDLRRVAREANGAFQRQAGGERGGGSGSTSTKLDMARFNAVFTENRVSDPVLDGGYGRWMEEADPDTCAALEAEERRKQQQLVRWRQPAPMPIARGIAYSELGETQRTDYSRSEGLRGGIQYTDYRLAHTTSKLVDDDDMDVLARRTDLRSIHTLKAHRAALSYQMTDDDAQAEAQAARDLEAAEARRLEALRRYDRTIESAYERTSRLLTSPSFSGRSAPAKP
jgi:curved DNA-binding protein CbpA